MGIGKFGIRQNGLGKRQNEIQVQVHLFSQTTFDMVYEVH